MDNNEDNPGVAEAYVEDIEQTEADIDPAPVAAVEAIEPNVAATPAPSFMRAPERAPPTPRWQWGLVAGFGRVAVAADRRCRPRARPPIPATGRG